MKYTIAITIIMVIFYQFYQCININSPSLIFTYKYTLLPSQVIRIRFSSATASFFIDPTALQLGQDHSIFIGQNRPVNTQ